MCDIVGALTIFMALLYFFCAKGSEAYSKTWSNFSNRKKIGLEPEKKPDEQKKCSLGVRRIYSVDAEHSLQRPKDFQVTQYLKFTQLTQESQVTPIVAQVN